MNVSTDYYKRYTQYNSQMCSDNGQQRIQHRRHYKGDDSSQQLLQTVDDSTKVTSSDKIKNPLDSLVESGTITSDQEKAIKDAFEASKMVFQTQAGASNASSTFKDPLESLVSAGSITKDQASAIKSAFDSDRKAFRMPPPPQFQQVESSNPMSNTLDNLVTSGTITSEQQEAILSALQSAFQTNQVQANTEADPLKSAFESAIKAYQNQSYLNEDIFWNRFDKGM